MQVSNANPFYAAGSMFNAAGNPVTVTGKDANGNVQGTTANGVKVMADSTGGMTGFSIADVLTPGDKAATGYDPSSGKINDLAIALANYRASGALKGDASPALIDALKTSLATTRSYPANPNLLLTKAGGPASNLAYGTLSALLTTQQVGALSSRDLPTPDPADNSQGQAVETPTVMPDDAHQRLEQGFQA